MRIDESSAAYQFLENATKPQTAKPNKWWVRIKPYNKRTGHLAGTINFTGLDRGRSLLLRERLGWRILDGPTPRMLRTILAQRNEGDIKPHACDVCTWEEAKRLEVEERLAKMREKEQRSAVDGASVLSTSDLPSNRDERDADRTANLARAKAAEQDERSSREDRAERLAEQGRATERDRLQRESEQLERELAAEGVPLEGATG